jgi:hypothetical protein
MSLLTINSAKLGRIIRVAETAEEARQVWKDHPEDRGVIYLANEVEAMKGINLETLQAIQAVKDVFFGAQVDRVETTKPETKAP